MGIADGQSIACHEAITKGGGSGFPHGTHAISKNATVKNVKNPS